MTDVSLSFDVAPVVALAGDNEPARLSGRAVAFGAVSGPSSVDGKRYRFHGDPDNAMVGTLAVREHDDYAPIGRIGTASTDSEGIDVVVDLLNTTAGRDSHAETLAQVRTGFSASFEVVESTTGDDGVIDVHRWNIRHLGHVMRPAFHELTQAVAASTEEVAPMETETAPVETPAPAPVLTVARPTRVPSLAEYGHALVRRDTAALERYAEAVNLAAGETLVANVPGIIPTQILGPAIDARPQDSPIFSALGPLAGPSAGASWKHPLVNDPLADASQVAELASANDTLGIVSVDLNWFPIKRSTVVSKETQVFSEPAVMGIVGDQLAKSYVRGREKIATAQLEGHSNGNTAITLAAGGTDSLAKLTGGSIVHYGQVGQAADLFVVNPVDYGKLASWTATDGRPLYPSAGQLVNVAGSTDGAVAFGGNVAGIRVIVSWALSAGKNFLLSSDYVKSYEGNRATISVEAATFGVTVGIFGTVSLGILHAKAVTQVNFGATELAAAKAK